MRRIWSMAWVSLSLLAWGCDDDAAEPGSSEPMGGAVGGGPAGGMSMGGAPMGGEAVGGRPMGGAPMGGSGGLGGAGGDTPCPDDLEFFEASVWRPVLSTSCVACHNDGGLAAESRFTLTLADTPEALQANFEATREVALTDLGGASVLLLRPSGQHPDGHTGGALLATESPAYEALAHFVARARGDGRPDCAGDACADPWPGHRRVRRLTRFEYDNTLTDVLGVALGAPVTVAEGFTAENVVAGFDNNAEALGVTALLTEQWLTAAESLADELVVRRPEALAALAGCADVEAEACAPATIEGLGGALFRRPLTAEEIARYQGLYDDNAALDGHQAGLRDVVVALLTSPHFLYRSELGEAAGEVYRLTPHEQANTLAYLVWGGPADDALVQAAIGGELSRPEGLRAQVRRLLADARARRGLWHFAAQWLEIERLPTVPRDAELFPELTPEVRASMLAQTEALVASVLLGGGDLSTLLTTTEAALDDTLAEFYGESGGLLDDARRPGVLAQGSVLTTHALPTSSSPIHRGKLVRERLLCQPLPPPPPGIGAEPPPLDPDLTTRERFTRHSEDEACAGCHRLVDPIGFGFERFDAVGRWRAEEGLDVTGQIFDAPNTPRDFDGLEALAGALAESPDVHACFADLWVIYGQGAVPGAPERCVTDATRAAFVGGGLTLESLLVGLASTPGFQYRAPDDVTPAEWAGAPEAPEAGIPEDAGVAPDAGGPDAEPPDMEAPDAEAPPQIEVDNMTVNDWGAGHCNEVIIRNPGDQPVDWVVQVDVDGTLTDHWNASADGDTGVVTFEGMPYNDIAPPGGQVQFGFCAQR